MSIFHPAEDKFTQMTQTPIPNLVATLAVPTIISMLVTSVYNMADTYFVGQIGTSATAAVGVALPLMAVIQAIGFTVSRLLGQQKREEAESMISVAFFSAFLCGLVLGVLGTVFIEPLVHFLGATDTSAPYTIDYVRFILIGAPGMVGIFSGAIVNIVLDPIFIFALDLGTGGAALATILSQFLSFCLLVGGTFRGTNIPLSFRQFRPSLDKYRIILANGLPSFWRQALASLATILLNVAGRSCGGDTVVAAMSIVSRVTMFAGSGIIGFGQGYQPVCGFNYGAGLYGRVREAFRFFFRVAFIAALALSILGFLFAPQVVALFRRDDPEVIYIGALALRLQCITFPLMSWLFPASMTLQTIGRSFKATVLAMCRQGLTFVPLILVLPYLWGVFGIQASQPLADILTFAVALPMGLGVLRELRLAQEGAEAQGTA